jgi:hypothetical protein
MGVKDTDQFQTVGLHPIERPYLFDRVHLEFYRALSLVRDHKNPAHPAVPACQQSAAFQRST